jgi:hypothetical protein
VGVIPIQTRRNNPNHNPNHNPNNNPSNPSNSSNPNKPSKHNKHNNHNLTTTTTTTITTSIVNFKRRATMEPQQLGVSRPLEVYPRRAFHKVMRVVYPRRVHCHRHCLQTHK